MTSKKQLFVIVMIVALLAALGSGLAAAQQAPAKAKYVFLFIGDGMAVAQRNAAEVYLASEEGLSRPEEAKLVMNTFPAQGMNTTYDLTSVIPDSASTATAISCGHKTKSGVIGMNPNGKVTYPNIAETAKKQGWKVGILSTVSLDHATPAAFYAHVPSRKQMYDICMQLVNSGFDYFAGGQMLKPTDKEDPGKPNALESAKQHGYTIATGRSEFDALQPGTDKIIAMSSTVDKDAAMYYTLDQAKGKDQITLAEFVQKGIDLLDNPKGFFMMVEGGKIDWACHANDAAASIDDTLALDAAIAEAVKFYQKHPQETLIVVTGDHETGGLTIGFAGTQYSSFVDKIQNQKMSYIEFDKKLAEYKKSHTPANAKLDDMMPVIKEAFGLYVMPDDQKAALEKQVAAGEAQGASDEMKKAGKDAVKKLKYSMALTDLELEVLQKAFSQSMQGEEERAKDDYTYLLYGGYEPLSVKLTTILNNKAGIAWTSYSHTGVPVQTSALGAGSELFNGYYDQTDIYKKLMAITGFTL
jgi:alkaline phosphatase